jgi:hypothetical protein
MISGDKRWRFFYIFVECRLRQKTLTQIALEISLIYAETKYIKISASICEISVQSITTE